jgi:hypothetical protein
LTSSSRRACPKLERVPVKLPNPRVLHKQICYKTMPLIMRAKTGPENVLDFSGPR